jgi:hypothetical protein
MSSTFVRSALTGAPRVPSRSRLSGRGSSHAAPSRSAWVRWASTPSGYHAAPGASKSRARMTSHSVTARRSAGLRWQTTSSSPRGSGTEIQLPTLALVIQVFLSSSGWMAVATQVKNVAHHNIFFWRPGDAAWSAVAELATCDRLHSVAFLGGKMYCLDYTMKFAIYDLNLGTASPPVLNYIGPLLCLLPNPRSRRKVRTCPAA